ncbi:CBS domain-containing protein [Mangrovitalea sediminis]|uniref:CBS domain-containing protein n=1 Tax=Mangrovitalea sediminis TaxID=1982043 RepID=UPI000BE4B3D9|nr:CBS domain-containing protein [Mangrovitalea sediminis]
MKKVNDILHAKHAGETFSVTPDTLVFDAIKLMSEKGIGALVVMENSQVVGIVSERDYLRKVSLMGRSSHATAVKEIMTPNPITVGVDQRMEACIELMTEKRIRHLPVIEDSKLVGIVSIGDLLRNMMEEQNKLIKQLESYMRGETY